MRDSLVSSVLHFGAAVALAAGIAWFAPARTAHAADDLPGPFDAASIDRTANACSNFFDYATGGWRKAHPIPPEYTEYGYIERLQDETQTLVRNILEAAAKNPGAAGTATQKIGDFYASCMDTAAIERDGLKALDPELARINAVTTPAALDEEIAHLHSLGVGAAFSLRAIQNPHDSTHVIANVSSGGTRLPERGYYFRDDAASQKLREQYVAHIAAMLRLAGDRSPEASAKDAMAVETALAEGAMTAAERRDPKNTDHPMTASEVAALMPHFPFDVYLHRTSIPPSGTINVAVPKFLTAFDAELTKAPLPAWRAYLRWQLVDAAAPGLPKRFEDEEFAFNGRILNGAKEQQPRWKRCVSATDASLGMAVGQVYVAKAFPPSAKQRALDMTLRMRDAYRAEMASLTWMSDATKATALAKLDAMGFKVGYPDVWRSYAGYRVERGSYAGNLIRGAAFERNRQLSQIGRPVDRTEWGMTPQTVNAYNAPSLNEIVLPAAQLQRPFFDEHADDASNLAATGAGTVGHEMTHGFDDQGHKFDLHGNLTNWWTPEDAARFDQRANCVVKQFDDAVAVGDTHYQGKLVEGEAIADLGGVVIGYRALETSLGNRPRTTLDGFTPEQRYFIAFAQSWTESVRDETAKRLALSDAHPLPRDRVNLTLRNVPGWYSAFNCTPPPSVCSVW
ncbi:MAG: M13 family metallopeptidase [Candidatus Eremiobacteraeota bacterium]|nr:M13 family metallopeptidase [Candidatus Eremiobacteraeota bacterium]